MSKAMPGLMNMPSVSGLTFTAAAPRRGVRDRLTGEAFELIGWWTTQNGRRLYAAVRTITIRPIETLEEADARG